MKMMRTPRPCPQMISNKFRQSFTSSGSDCWSGSACWSSSSWDIFRSVKIFVQLPSYECNESWHISALQSWLFLWTLHISISFICATVEIWIKLNYHKSFTVETGVWLDKYLSFQQQHVNKLHIHLWNSSLAWLPTAVRCLILDSIYFQQMEILTDSNDEGEELLRSAPAENVSEELVASHCPGVTHRPSGPSGPRAPDPTERKHTITTTTINNDELFIILHKSSSKRGEELDDSGATCDTSGSDQHYGDNDQNVNNVMGDHCVAAGPHTVHHYPDQPMSLSHQSLRQSHSSYTPSSTPSSSSSSSHDRSCDGKLDHSDSDSGVSDLSSDLTFYNGININTFTPTNYTPREKEMSKPTIDHTTKKSKFNKKFQDFPHSRRSILKMQENFYHGILYWVKLILLVMLIFFLILTVFIVSHVKCFNDICAISLETKINYHKYASPI